MANQIRTILKPADNLIKKIEIKPSGDLINKIHGNFYPLIIIKDYIFEQEDIQNFEIDSTGKLPRFRATLFDTKRFFSVNNLPKDGDVAQVRIMSRQIDTYRDIRINFDLDRVNISKNENAYIIKVSGEIKIPGIHADDCKGYPKQTSFQHLQDIATELGLGFASNVNSTDDEMIHFLANENRINLINRIVEHAYRVEGSFHDWMIDPYYNLNFVDIEQILNLERKAEAAYTNLKFDSSFFVDDESLNKIGDVLVLSNGLSLEGTNQYIKSHRIINNAGDVVKRTGYRKRIKYFENDTQNGLIEFEINPNVTKNIDELEEGLGKRNNEEQFKIENKITYLGRQDDGLEYSNVHLNYLYSPHVYLQNMDELEKIKLEIELDAFNPAIHLYQFVPVVIFVSNSTEIIALQNREKILEENGLLDDNKKINGKDADNYLMVVDPNLSGFYMIRGIKYIYNQASGFSQKILLARREWPII